MRRVFFLCLLLIAVIPVRADEIDDIAKKIAEIKVVLDKSRTESKPLEETVRKLERDIQGVEVSIVTQEREITQKDKQIISEEKTLDKQKQALDTRVRGFYKKSRASMSTSLGYVFRENISDAIRSVFLQQKQIQTDRDLILKTAFRISSLEERKAVLENERNRLAQIKQTIAQQKEGFAKELAKIQGYQQQLEQEIASLNARQQQLIAQKQASLGIPRSAGTSARGCSSDLTNGKDPGFSPRIGFFTYGAPHRNGLNQYGAWGRAKAGQNEEQILAEYYPGLSLKKDYDQNTQISVDGYGNFSIEEYVKRIYEVPDSWTDNNLAVLKAQAVAARTYALNSMQRNGHICTTESCQVFKPEPKGGNWEQAVNATAGWVMMDGGSPGFTQYASTHGGYVLNLGKFDGAGSNPGSFAELNERAYDKDSPWFYCNWGSRSEYSGTAWMKPSEVADILNVIELARRDSSTIDKLYQPDKPHPEGREVWSPDRVKQELRARGGSPVDSVSSVSVSVDFSSGKTTGISGGGISASGSEFKDWFNLRAPANIQIVGPLYNVEQR